MSETVRFHGQDHVVTRCGTCGISHTVPQIVWDTQVAEGGFHACPNGHMRGWDKSSSGDAAIRRERDRLKQNAARLEEEAAGLRDMLSKQTAETARVLSAKAKMEKRANAGVCQCCNRSFSNVARHMKTKHPTVKAIKATA